MSKNINVNPGNYKVAGRERQGEDVVHEVERRKATRIGNTARKTKPRSMALVDARTRASHRPKTTRSRASNSRRQRGASRQRAR
jgi:hypothetical protein